jgi:biopolymer transport protein ExbB/TolQ
MKAFNFSLIFLLCLALVLFSLENSQPTAIAIVRGVEVEAPLAVELIFAMGIGAVLVWLFSLLSKLQKYLEARQDLRAIRQRDERIEQLEQDLQAFQQNQDNAQNRETLASENTPQLLPAEEAAASDNAKQEAIAVENIDRPA